MKNSILLILIFMFNFCSYSQQMLSFRQLEDILKEGRVFSSKDVIKFNDKYIVEIAKVEDFIIYLPLSLYEETKNENFDTYSSGGFVLLYDSINRNYFEIRVDRKGINVQNLKNDSFKVEANLFYEFREGYSIGIDITLIDVNKNKYSFKLTEHQNNLIVNSKSIENKYFKNLTLNDTLDTLEMLGFFEKINALDFNKISANNNSFYFK